MLPEHKRRGSAVLFFYPIWLNIILAWYSIHSWEKLRIMAFSASTEADRCLGAHRSLGSDNIHPLPHRHNRSIASSTCRRSRWSSCNHILRSGTSTVWSVVHSRTGSAASFVHLDRPGTIAIIVARFSIHEAVLASRAVIAPDDRRHFDCRRVIQPIQIFWVAPINAHDVKLQCVSIYQSHFPPRQSSVLPIRRNLPG